MIEFVAMTTALPQEKAQVESGVIRKYPLERRYYYTDYEDVVLLEDFREKKIKKLKSQDIKVALNRETKEKESKKEYCINERTVVVYFDFDKYNLKPFEKEKIDKVFSHLKDKKDLKVYVSGYTDNVGTKAYNDILACKRAKTVQDYIKKKYTKNVYIEQVEGKCCYLSKIQKFNRRAEIKIQYKGKCEN